MMNNVKICVPRLLTAKQKEQAIVEAIKENPLNRAWGLNPQRMAVEVGKRWSNGKVLHVKFLNGNATQKAKCEQHVHTIETFANIKFVFDDSPTAEIRVAFYDGGKWNDQGSWSYVGTDCLVTPKDEQTVNFGWLDADTPDQEWERVAVHEFLHACGADHEDQQPAADIKWNKPAVYAYFTGPPNNWSTQDVDTNVLDRISPEGISYTVFDPVSIMAYEIPPEFTLDGKGVKGGDVPSVLDKQKMGQMYPFGVTPLPTPTIPLLAVDGPHVFGTVSVANPVNTFSLPLSADGTYRIWTSLSTAAVSVFKENDMGRPLGSNVQQLTVFLGAGRYEVVISPLHPGTQAQYSIHAAKIK